MMAIDDPRPTELFDRSKRSERAPAARRKFIGELLADAAMEASALLAVLGEFMVPDDEMTTVIHRELSTRPPRRPQWLDRLGQSRVHRAVRVSHELDRVDILLLQGGVPGAHGDFTCEVTIAERFERVRGADLHPEGIDELLATVPATQFRCEEVDLADVRARLTRAIDDESNLPPIKSETWPHSRALVEWLLKKLPEGATAEPRPEFGAETGVGDPMRWSNWRAHDWLDNGEAGPKLLQTFISYSHDEVGIRRAATAEVLTAIESWVPEYRQALRSKLA